MTGRWQWSLEGVAWDKHGQTQHPTPSCCSHFLLGSLSPSSESHSQRLLPHKHQLPGQGGEGTEWAGAPKVPTKGLGTPYPPLGETTPSSPTPKSPAN